MPPSPSSSSSATRRRCRPAEARPSRAFDRRCQGGTEAIQPAPGPPAKARGEHPKDWAAAGEAWRARPTPRAPRGRGRGEAALDASTGSAPATVDRPPRSAGSPRPTQVGQREQRQQHDLGERDGQDPADPVEDHRLADAHKFVSLPSVVLPMICEDRLEQDPGPGDRQHERHPRRLEAEQPRVHVEEYALDVVDADQRQPPKWPVTSDMIRPKSAGRMIAVVRVWTGRGGDVEFLPFLARPAARSCSAA